MSAKVAIVDFGLGNLYNVLRGCQAVGLDAEVTSSPADVRAARGVILPGVGAFADAMRNLEARELVAPLVEAHREGKPLFGICLGMQLLMEESAEFGTTKGLGLCRGTVERIAPTDAAAKVPHVGWSAIELGGVSSPIFDGIPDGSVMYFVHSFSVRPIDAISAATTSYGGTTIHAAVSTGSTFGCQFHPERSGELGLTMYRNFGKVLGS